VTPAWLSATRPEVVVISVGRDNPYGHPSPWALRYYATTASQVYRTDVHGEVSVRGRPDGSYEVVTATAAPGDAEH
jgi:competence protein ComEC